MELTRRKFFTHFGQAFIGGLRRRAVSLADTPPESGRSSRPRNVWVRPPGALAEPEFLETCTRCTDCLTACPYDSIRRLGPEFGPNAGTPAIVPHESPCYLCRDMPCIEACEPKALVMQPVSEMKMGLAVLESDACYVTQGQPCDYCLIRCPLKDEAINADQFGAPIIHEDACTGCGVCAYLCPGGALSIVPSGSGEPGSGSASAQARKQQS